MTISLARRRMNPLMVFLKFAVIGGLGTVTNLILFFLMVDILGGPAVPVSTFCYLICATQNYLLNHYWTFSGGSGSATPSKKQWGKYLLGSLAGLVVNLLILQLTLHWFPAAVYSQLLGIGASLVVNFVMAKYFVFQTPKPLAAQDQNK
ncbi:putative flippase GtrA [Oxalobacteraceae bacterium GrIS 2.11]